MSRLRPALAAATLFALAACGGDDSQPGSGDAVTLPGLGDPGAGDPTGTDPVFTMPEYEEELVEVADIQVRFANYSVDTAGGVDLDLYWGTTEGSKGPTLPFGQVTDWMPITVPAFKADGGEVDLAVPLLVAGTTDLFSPVQYVSQTLSPGDRMTFVLGNSRSFDGQPQYQYSFVFEHEMGPAPAGKALVVFNTVAVGGIEGGDFMSLYLDGGCEQWAIDNSVPSGNGGTAYVVDPGSLQIFGSDANSDCSMRTPSVPLEATEGSVWLVIAHGTTLENRELTVLQVA